MPDIHTHLLKEGFPPLQMLFNTVLLPFWWCLQGCPAFVPCFDSYSKQLNCAFLFLKKAKIGHGTRVENRFSSNLIFRQRGFAVQAYLFFLQLLSCMHDTNIICNTKKATSLKLRRGEINSSWLRGLGAWTFPSRESISNHKVQGNGF